MKPLGHFPTIVISVCLVIFSCECTIAYGIDNHDVTDKSEIQDLKMQVNSLTATVGHLLRESKSKEIQVNYLTSVIEHFLEESKSKENRISSLENKVAKLEKTIHIQTVLNSQVEKETQYNYTFHAAKQEKTSIYLSKQDDSDLHRSEDSQDRMRINQHTSSVEKTGDSIHEIGVGQHITYKSELIISQVFLDFMIYVQKDL